MKISIAMTTYNGEKYVLKQLNSLLEQTRQADEVIIADDRSTDNTPQLIEKFIKDNNLNNWTFYINENNLGFIKNFKNVISKTTGDLIFLCDQDDIWLPNKLEELEKLFSENENALAINSSFNFINGDDEAFTINQNENTSNQNIINFSIAENALEKISYSTIIKYNISPGCTMAFRSSLKDNLLKNTEYSIPHDWEINLLACVGEGLYFYNKPLINYRIHNSNTIGLSTEEEKPALKIKGDYKKRLEVLDCMINLYSLLKLPYFFDKANKKEKRFIVRSYKFSKLREKVLKERKITAWLRLLWFQAPYLWQGNTLRIVLGDLVFMLKLHK